MDLGDLQHNTRDGIHIASLAGAWLAAVAGFGGMRDHGGALSFAPRLPQRITRLSFRLCYRGTRLKVDVTARQARYSLLEGDSLDVAHHGTAFTVTAAKTAIHRIPPAPEVVAPRQPAGRAPARRQAPR